MPRNFKAENSVWERASLLCTCLYMSVGACYLVRLLAYAL